MNYLKKGESILPVTDLYPYRYDFGKGKTVLRIKCDGSIGFATIQSFFSETADYDYYEGEDGLETLMNTYTQYGADVDIHYTKNASNPNVDGTVTPSTSYYSIEVVRDPSIEATITTIQSNVSNLNTQVSALASTTDSLKTYAENTGDELTATQLALVEQYESNIAMEESLSETQSELETTKTQLATTKEELVSAQNELVAAQIALVELYESIIAIEDDLSTPATDENVTEETTEPTEPTIDETVEEDTENSETV